MSKSPAPAAPIRLSVNAIINGIWHAAGSELPFATPGDVPTGLQPFIEAPADADEPGTPTLNFQLNRVYNTNPEGAILSRSGRRQAAQLAGEAAAQAQAEDAAEAAGALDPETAAILQEKHGVDVALQIKAAEVAQARRDAPVIAARREAEAAAEGKPAPKLYVKRGTAFWGAEKTRLRPGEQVYARQPSGEWWTVGLIDATGALPPGEVTL